MQVTRKETTVEFTAEEWGDIVDTAGYGIGYWADTAEVDDELYTYTVHENEVDDVFTVTKPDLERAWALIVNRKVTLNDTIRGYFDASTNENDLGHIDATCADVLVQVAIFGEVVYG